MGIYWTIQYIEKWEEVKNTSYLLGVHKHIWPEFINAGEKTPSNCVFCN